MEYSLAKLKMRAYSRLRFISGECLVTSYFTRWLSTNFSFDLNLPVGEQLTWFEGKKSSDEVCVSVERRNTVLYRISGSCNTRNQYHGNNTWFDINFGERKTQVVDRTGSRWMCHKMFQQQYQQRWNSVVDGSTALIQLIRRRRRLSIDWATMRAEWEPRAERIASGRYCRLDGTDVTDASAQSTLTDK